MGTELHPAHSEFTSFRFISHFIQSNWKRPSVVIPSTFKRAGYSILGGFLVSLERSISRFNLFETGKSLAQIAVRPVEVSLLFLKFDACGRFGLDLVQAYRPERSKIDSAEILVHSLSPSGRPSQRSQSTQKNKTSESSYERCTLERVNPTL